MQICTSIIQSVRKLLSSNVPAEEIYPTPGDEAWGGGLDILINPNVEINVFIVCDDDPAPEFESAPLEFEGDNTEYIPNGDGILLGDDIGVSFWEATRIWLGILDDNDEEPWPLIPLEVYRPTLIMCGQCWRTREKRILVAPTTVPEAGAYKSHIKIDWQEKKGLPYFSLQCL